MKHIWDTNSVRSEISTATCLIILVFRNVTRLLGILKGPVKCHQLLTQRHGNTFETSDTIMIFTDQMPTSQPEKINPLSRDTTTQGSSKNHYIYSPPERARLMDSAYWLRYKWKKYGTVLWFPATRNFCALQSIQINSTAHPVTYSRGTRITVSGGHDATTHFQLL